MSEGLGVHRWLTSAQLDLLRTDPWFGSLSADFASHLLALAEPRRLLAGETLFLRGDPPCGLYAVLDGALRVSGGTEAGKEAILSLLDPPVGLVRWPFLMGCLERTMWWPKAHP